MRKRGTFELETVCPYCGRRNQLVTGAGPTYDGTRPVDGDVTVCIACGAPAVFALELPDRLRPPTAEETTELLADPDVVLAQAAVRALRPPR